MPESETKEPRSENAPFSLFLDIEQGRHADLDAAARSMLALSAAIKDLSYVIDPSLSIKLEFDSGSEGSLFINAVIKSLNPKDLFSTKNLITVAVTAALWFRHEILDYTFQHVADYLQIEQPTLHTTPENKFVHLAPEDRDAIAHKVVELLREGVAKDKVQSVYRSLHTNSSVRGVGASQAHRRRPTQIVPRSEFLSRAGAKTLEEIEEKKRIRTTTETLTLVSPVLLSESPRKWRVIGAEGEFGASIKDHQFQEDMTNGRLSVPMVSNIQLIVSLETKETFENGAWVVTERNILKVDKVIFPLKQTALDLSKTSYDAQ